MAGHSGDDSDLMAFAVDSGAAATLVRDSRQPLVAVSIRLSAGSRRDPAGRSGLSHLVEHLMYSGTKTYARGEYLRAIQSVGAVVNATTSADWTKFYYVITPELLEPLLDLERQRFGESRDMMTDAVLDLERAVVLSERQHRMDNVAYGHAARLLTAELFDPGTGYHHLPIGTVADVSAASLVDCLEHHAAHYVGSRINVAVAGHVDLAEAAANVLPLLEAFPADPDPEPPAVTATLTSTRRTTVAGEFAPKVFLGCLLPPEGSWEFELARFASFFLGRGTASWLPDRLVRQSGLAASVAVKTMGRARGPSIGTIEVVPRAGQDVERLIAAVDDAVEAARGDQLDEAALGRARSVYRTSWLTDIDSVRRRSDALSLSMQLTGSVAAHFEHDARVRRISLADLRRALGYWHQPQRRAELVYTS